MSHKDAIPGHRLPEVVSGKAKAPTFLLCCFLGPTGAHRFYLGRWKTGLLMLMTLGGLGIWWLVDAVLVATGTLRDAYGRPLYVGPPDPTRIRAGFGVRLAAFIVDSVILGIIGSVAGAGIVLVLSQLVIGEADSTQPAPHWVESNTNLRALIWFCGATMVALLVLFYFTIQHQLRPPSTIGKLCFNICVTTHRGMRMSFGHSLARTLAYILSALPLGAGFLLAARRDSRLALHDIVVNSRVHYIVRSTDVSRARGPKSPPDAMPPSRPPAAN